MAVNWVLLDYQQLSAEGHYNDAWVEALLEDVVCSVVCMEKRK